MSSETFTIGDVVYVIETVIIYSYEIKVYRNGDLIHAQGITEYPKIRLYKKRGEIHIKMVCRNPIGNRCYYKETIIFDKYGLVEQLL